MSKKLSVFDKRQTMQRADFEIQHKRDTVLKDVELHHHDFYEIYYLVSGDVTYVIEGKLCRIMPGDLLLVSPRELHQVTIGEGSVPYERYVLWVEGDFVRRLSTEKSDLERGLNPLHPGHTNILRLSPEQQIVVRNLMETIFTESESESFGSDLLTRSLVGQLLVQINRLAEQSGSDEYFVYANPLVSELVDYVNRHYREKLTLDDLADRFYISKYHLSHEFQKHMGVGIYRYIQKKRLQIAKFLLTMGEAPSNIPGLCGFGDYPGFYRAFTAEYGVAPKAFARSARLHGEDQAKEM